MKLTETIVAALIKRGLSGDMRNFKTTVEIPSGDPMKPSVKITVTADNLQIKVEKE